MHQPHVQTRNTRDGLHDRERPDEVPRGLLSRMFKADVLHQLVQEARKNRDDGTFVARLVYALNTGLLVPASGLARIPRTGPVVIVANHPFGGTVEGLLVATLLRRLRADVRPLIRGLSMPVPELEDECFVLQPHSANGSRESNTSAALQAAQFVQDGGVLVTFPGALAEAGWVNRRDDESWHPVAVSFAQQANASVVPAYIDGGGTTRSGSLSSSMFPELAHTRRIVSLRNRSIHAHIGHPISPEELRALGTGRSAVEALRQRTFELARVDDRELEQHDPSGSLE